MRSFRVASSKKECFDGCPNFVVSLLKGNRQISSVTILVLGKFLVCAYALPQWSDVGLPSARAKKSDGLLVV